MSAGTVYSGIDVSNEPPRENWRLRSLRGWSDDKTRQVPLRGTRADGAVVTGSPP